MPKIRSSAVHKTQWEVEQTYGGLFSQEREDEAGLAADKILRDFCEKNDIKVKIKTLNFLKKTDQLQIGEVNVFENSPISLLFVGTKR